MTVNVTSTITEQYTWSAAPLTWLATTKSWADAGYINYQLDASEAMATADALCKLFTAVPLETLKISDSCQREIVLKAAESLRFTEVYWDNIKFYMTVCESMILNEGHFKCLDKNSQEKFRIGEQLYKVLAAKIKDSIAFQEILKRHAVFLRLFDEALKAADKSARTAGLRKVESLGVFDEPSNNIVLNKSDPLTLLDEFTRRIILERNFNEPVNIGEVLGKAVTLNKEDAVRFYDVIIRACEAVLSNFYIEYGDMDLEDFLSMVDTPGGYTSFTDFKVGEYEYQQALVRLLIQANVLSSQPSVSGVTMYVDIPDTDDRGTVVITDDTDVTRVHYNRFYYNAPEVSVIVVGGNTSDGVLTPHLITTSGNDDAGRYFEVEILNSSGVRTTGTISWVSKGY